VPISEVSFSNSFTHQQQEAKHETGPGFADMLLKAVSSSGQDSGFTGLKASPIPSGKSLLANDYWPERFMGGVEAGADKLGLETEEFKEKFADIMQDAHDNGGFVNPKAYLKSLSNEDREIIQRMHGLADPLTDGRIAGLLEEGAVNLLLPRGAQKDWNGDGLYSVADAAGFRFPTDQTPKHIAEAWEKTVADMPEDKRLMAEAKVFGVFASANFIVENGRVVGQYAPGDPEMKDPFSELDFEKFARERLAWNEHIKHQIKPEQYHDTKSFWESFQANLA